MRKVLILALLMVVQPALALEHLTSDNFDHDTSVTPEKAYYLPGDIISATYKITPKTDDDMELIGGEKDNPRTYTFRTSLLDPQWTISINYYMGSWTEDHFGSEVRVDVKYFYIDEQRKGVRSVEVNISGKIPTVDQRLENVVVVNVSVEDADSNSLPSLTVRVVNKEKFLEDIQKLRRDTDTLKSDLDNSGVVYNKSDFDEMYSLLDSAQNLVNADKYVEADSKISMAEEKLNSLKLQADKLKAETERDYVDNILKDAYLNLSVTEIALNKVGQSKNYTLFVETYAELKSRYDTLKNDFEDAEQLINDKKYDDAYGKLVELRPEAEKLLKDIDELKAKIEGELENKEGFFPFGISTSAYLVIGAGVAVAIAIAIVVVALMLRKRRGKWDELR